MTDDPGVHDFSRLDAHLASTRRTAFLHSVWRPLLAGAAGAALVIAAVYVTLPKFSVREVVADHVVVHDVPFTNHIPQDKPFDNYVPHEVQEPVAAAAPLVPRTSEERTLEGSDAWKGADVRGRILRPDRNGFVLAGEAGEQSFYPARLGADGKPEADEGMKDVVSGLLNDLAFCRPSPSGLYQCFALHAGRSVVIPEIPVSAKRERRA